MMSDAISHAVLPGLVIAYFISGSREVLPMLLGAAAFGLLASVVIESMGKWLRIQQDAAIGVTYTWLFALGVVLISFFADDLDIDQDCVLYGDIAFAPLDLWMIGETTLGPRALYMTGMLTILVLLFVRLGYKGLLLTSFAPDYAQGKGIKVANWHYALMAMVSLNTVISFELVGAILVVGLTIITPATAYLLSNDLPKMMRLTVVLGLIASISGYYFSAWLDLSITAAIVVMAGLQFIIVLVTQQICPRKLAK